MRCDLEKIGIFNLRTYSYSYSSAHTFTIEFFMLDLDIAFIAGIAGGPRRLAREKKSGGGPPQGAGRCEYCHIPINYAHVYGPILHLLSASQRSSK